jgi:hypothetical protein
MTYTGSKAQAGRGSTLSIGGTPTEIGEVSEVPFTRPEWEFVETTNFDSGSDAEMLSTMRKVADITFTFNRVSSDAGQVLVEAAYVAGTITAFVLQLPKTAAQTTTGDKYTFNAFVIGSDIKVSPKDKVAGTVKLQTSGPVTLTVGS